MNRVVVLLLSLLLSPVSRPRSATAHRLRERRSAGRLSEWIILLDWFTWLLDVHLIT